MTKLTKIALVDDHTLVLNSLEKLVQSFEQYHVVCKAANGQEFIALMENTELIPDIVLLDNNMPIMNGFETLKWLSKNLPLVRVLILSMEDDEQLMLKMIRAGAKGYLLKDCEPNELNWALNEVMEKGYHYTKKVNGLLKVAKKSRSRSKDKKPKDLLKESELTFIKLACSDLTYKEIADQMQLSPKTIDGYRQDVFTKLEVKNRVGMVLYAVKHKIIEL